MKIVKNVLTVSIIFKYPISLLLPEMAKKEIIKKDFFYREKRAFSSP
jgi:hypothetical protein